MKLCITIGLTLFGIIGGWLGGLLDHGNGLGGWSLLFGTLGSFLGIWVGFKAAQSWL